MNELSSSRTVLPPLRCVAHVATGFSELNCAESHRLGSQIAEHQRARALMLELADHDTSCVFLGPCTFKIGGSNPLAWYHHNTKFIGQFGMYARELGSQTAESHRSDKYVRHSRTEKNGMHCDSALGPSTCPILRTCHIAVPITAAETSVQIMEIMSLGSRFKTN